MEKTTIVTLALATVLGTAGATCSGTGDPGFDPTGRGRVKTGQTTTPADPGPTFDRSICPPTERGCGIILTTERCDKLEQLWSEYNAEADDSAAATPNWENTGRGQAVGRYLYALRHRLAEMNCGQW